MSASHGRSRMGMALAAGAMAVLAGGYAAAQGRRREAAAPITIQKQGSFAVGGKFLATPTPDRCTAITATSTTRFR